MVFYVLQVNTIILGVQFYFTNESIRKIMFRENETTTEIQTFVISHIVWFVQHE